MKRKMERKSLALLLLVLVACSQVADKNGWIKIDQVDELTGDFSFKEQWSYPEGVYRNSFGQLSCDGICPPGIEKMMDMEGRIFEDSLQAFYQLVDTTHRYHSIKSEAWAYEWSTSDFINVKEQDDGALTGQTEYNASTHSSLNFTIRGDSLTAWIELASIVDSPMRKFPLLKGIFKIEKKGLEEGVLKAKFDLTFDNTLEKGKKMYWKGLVYSRIEM